MDDNQNDIPDVAPFKPQFNPIRVQKATPKPFVQETVTYSPFGQSAPSVAPFNTASQLQHDSNPYGQPGPFVGNNYLPPNDYLPPSNAVPARAASGAQTNFLVAPTDSHLTAAGSSSVFQYV